MLLNRPFLGVQTRLIGRFGKIACFCDFVCLFFFVFVNIECLLHVQLTSLLKKLPFLLIVKYRSEENVPQGLK